MKVTHENIKDINYIAGYNKSIETGKNLLDSLLIDLNELNNELINRGESYKQIYIDIFTEHTIYSPERTDPCPDYYGYLTLRFENDPSEHVGLEMDLDTLDDVICSLINFIEYTKD